MTLGRILFDSPIFGLTPAYSGTEVSGFGAANLNDWLEWTYFRATGATTLTVDYTLAAAADVDHWSVWHVYPDNPSGAYSFKLYRDLDGVSGWTLVDTVTVSADTYDKKFFLRSFTSLAFSAGGKVRLQIELADAGDAVDVRQFVVGKALVFPIGQHGGIKPPTLQGGYVASNRVSVNGSFIGRDLIRQEKSGAIELEYLEESWIVTNWPAIRDHIKRYAFLWAWDLDGHPNDIAWCAPPEKIPSPVHSGGNNKLAVQIPVKMLSENMDA